MGTLAELNDDIVGEAVRGSGPARDRVAAAMNDQMRLMVYARLNPTTAQRGQVEELTQQSMEAFLRGLADLEIPTVAAIRAYASTIVTRRVADFIRDPVGVGRGKPQPMSLDSTVAYCSAAGPLWQFLSASVASPLSAVAFEDQLQRVMIELGQLKQEYRAAITMAFFDQLSTAQMAQRMGISRPASSMVLLRAVKALRKRLTGEDRSGAGEHNGT